MMLICFLLILSVFTEIQNELGINGTCFFRAVPERWDERIIHKISDLGHEIGYHFENLTTCIGNLSLAMGDFRDNLKN